MQLGLDCLGLAKFGGEAKKAFPKGYALGVFSKTFGDAMPAVREVVQASKCPAVRVQLLWSDAHTFSDANVTELRTEATRWERFARDNRGVAVFLSPFCEHKLSNPDKYLDIVKAAAPTCTPVNTPWTGGLSSKYMNEVHGTKDAPRTGKFNYSYDGTDMLETDVEAVKKKYKGAAYWFGWTANFNGVPEADVKIPRPNRTDWPTAKLIRSIQYIMDRSKAGTKLPSNWLWKSHAEDKSNNDPRANKPVLIAPVKSSAAQLMRNGKVVATAQYYGAFVDGRSRYYFGEWGFELAEKHGRPLDIAVGGKVYGTVDPAFRDGAFR